MTCRVYRRELFSCSRSTSFSDTSESSCRSSLFSFSIMSISSIPSLSSSLARVSSSSSIRLRFFDSYSARPDSKLAILLLSVWISVNASASLAATPSTVRSANRLFKKAIFSSIWRISLRMLLFCSLLRSISPFSSAIIFSASSHSLICAG